MVNQSLDQVCVVLKVIKTIGQHKWHVGDVGLIVLHICATIQMRLYKFFCLRWFLNTQAALFVLPYVVKKIRGFCIWNCMVLLYCHRLWNIIEGHNTNYQECWEKCGCRKHVHYSESRPGCFQWTSQKYVIRRFTQQCWWRPKSS